MALCSLADSLEVVDLIMSVEDAFGIELPDEAAGTRSIASAIAWSLMYFS